MKKTILIFIIFFTSCTKQEEKKIEKPKPKIEKKLDVKTLQKELDIIDTKLYLEQYIEKVIKEGSSTLGFVAGGMKGGFAIDEDIEKISHYVVTLSGKVCKKHEMAAKAEMFFTSNCGGCHGNDGKGLNGAFPDLTKPTLLGIKKRKEYLKYEINKLTNHLNNI
jgi:hypothetical protein